MGGGYTEVATCVEVTSVDVGIARAEVAADVATAMGVTREGTVAWVEIACVLVRRHPASVTTSSKIEPIKIKEM